MPQEKQEKKVNKNIPKSPKNPKGKVNYVLELFKQKEISQMFPKMCPEKAKQNAANLKRLSVEKIPKYAQEDPKSEESAENFQEGFRKSEKKPKNCLSIPKIPPSRTTIKSKSKITKSTPRKYISSTKDTITKPKNNPTLSKGKKSSSSTPRKKVRDIRNYFENFQAKKEKLTDKCTFGAACQVDKPSKQGPNFATSRLTGIKPSSAYTALSHSSTPNLARPQTGLKPSESSTCHTFHLENRKKGGGREVTQPIQQDQQRLRN